MTCGCRLAHDDNGAVFGVRGKAFAVAAAAQRGSTQGAGLEGMGQVEALLCMEVTNFDEQLSARHVTSEEEASELVALVGGVLGAGHYAPNMALLLHAGAKGREAAGFSC